jgi:hypothetical protein
MRSRRSRLRVWAGSLPALLVLGLSACGSAAATHSDSAPVSVSRPASAATATRSPAASGAASVSQACASTVAGTLGQVAGRVYHVAATSEDVTQAVHRVQSSPALVAAIGEGNAGAARAALRSLLLNQIVAIQVLRDGRRFAAAGAGPAIAPVTGSIPGTGASFVLSVQSDRSYIQVTHRVTGAQILLIGRSGRAPGATRLAGTFPGPPPARVPSTGSVSYAGQSYQVVSVGGAVYPAGALRIALLVAANSISCPASLVGDNPVAQARVETLGAVGQRIYQEELHSQVVAATVRLLESSQAFKRAVAQESAAATRAAIVGFFEAHLHVVRVRVTIGGRLLVDVGGPYVLAPVHGTLRSGGRVIGNFEMAIQDDAGYLKLAHLFTGAQVLMRVGSKQVMGTLSPGPASLPERGRVSYRGRSYQAYSFTGEAFPSGPLRISLLLSG